MPGAARQAAEGKAEERGAQLRGGDGQQPVVDEIPGVREVGRDLWQGVLEQDCQGVYEHVREGFGAT
eukprot:5761793-Prymnesium_polylepis.1